MTDTIPRLKIEIRRNSNKEMSSIIWQNATFPESWWTEGNGSCDCNRRIFFQEGKGERY